MRFESVVVVCLMAIGCTLSNPDFGPGDPRADGAVTGSGGSAGGQGGMPGTGGIYGTGGSGTGGSGTGEGIDTASPVDLIVVLPPDGGAPALACGTQRPDPSVITGSRGIAVEAGGVIFYTREVAGQVSIGRLAPGSAAQPSWLALPASAQPRTLRADSSRGILYIAASGTDTLYGASLSSGAVFLSISGLPAIHGLAVADDGAIFASSGNGHVYRLTVDIALTARSQTTTETIFPSGQRPLGLAFGPDGSLYVGSSSGRIKRFRVLGDKLVEGTDYSQFTGSANDLAFDIDGQLYVADSTGSTARALTIVPPAGYASPTTTGAVGLLSALAFGRGALDCQDVYITDATGPARRQVTAAAGLKTR